VAEAEAQGHGKRLAQRQRAVAGVAKAVQDAQPTHAQRAEPAQALGLPRARAEREVRKQTLLTVRTLWLENALRAFLDGLLEPLPTKVRWEMSLPLLLARGGARMATNSQVVYWGNTAGLSVPYRRILTEGVEGLCVLG
jgi:hypothetical protein